MLYKDFHPNNVNSSNAEVDSAQMVQYVMYIKMKTDVFQKLSHSFLRNHALQLEKFELPNPMVVKELKQV